MDSVKSRTDELQKDMDRAWASLRSQAYRLAQWAITDDGPVSLISPTLRTGFQDAVSRHDSIKAMVLAGEEERRRLDEGRQSVSRLEKEKAQGEKKLAELEELIGAVAMAQGDSPDADPGVKEAITPFIERRNSLAEAAGRGGLRAIASKAQLALYKRGEAAVFTEIFHTLESKDLLDKLSGDRAGALVDAYRALSKSTRKLSKELEAGSDRLSARELLMDDDQDGSRLKAQEAQADDAQREAGIAYGLYLFDNGGKWISQDTSDSVLDLVQGMLDEQGHIEECRRNMEKERDWAAIEDFKSMISFNDSRIEALRREIRTIEEEIAQVEEENEGLRRKISNVEARLK